MTNPQPVLVADSIRKSFRTRAGELVVLRDVSLSVGAGESVAIMGPSGSGKSTFLSIVGTLEPPESGTVTIDNTDPFVLGERELARFRNRKVGFVFQDHYLLPQCSVLENVLVPALVDDRAELRRIAGERAEHLLERVGLSGRLDHRPAELSGGERQRVAIARALMNHPLLLLADEPTGNLDRKTADIVSALLLDLVHDQSVALVVATHSERLAERAMKKYELADGALAAC